MLHLPLAQSCYEIQHVSSFHEIYGYIEAYIKNKKGNWGSFGYSWIIQPVNLPTAWTAKIILLCFFSSVLAQNLTIVIYLDECPCYLLFPSWPQCNPLLSLIVFVLPHAKYHLFFVFSIFDKGIDPKEKRSINAIDDVV